MFTSLSRHRWRAIAQVTVAVGLVVSHLACSIAARAHAVTGTPVPTEPTVVDLPVNTGGLAAQGFYIVGGLLLAGALVLVLMVALRSRRR